MKWNKIGYLRGNWQQEVKFHYLHLNWKVTEPTVRKITSKPSGLWQNCSIMPLMSCKIFVKTTETAYFKDICTNINNQIL